MLPQPLKYKNQKKYNIIIPKEIKYTRIKVKGKIKINVVPYLPCQNRLYYQYCFFLNFAIIYSIPDPTPSAMTALHQFGAEMLKLSRGLESSTVPVVPQKPTVISMDLPTFIR